MSRRTTRAALLAGAAALTAAVTAAAPLAASAAPSDTALAARNERVCATPAAGAAACLSIRHVPASPDKPGNNGKGGGHKPGGGAPAPVSYGATDLQSAYALGIAAASQGSGSTVAIVDAYDDPNAYADLVQYRDEQGLPDIAECTTAAPTGPCLRKVDQRGGTDYPAGNSAWAQEISLDLDMVSAICPLCDILLVEADSASLADLAAAVDTAAARPGVVAISNSYGAGEFATEDTFAASHYSHGDIAVTAAAGDSGYGVSFPAAASTVIAVGGTSLRESNGSWDETVWSGTGSGCSQVVAQPAWQQDLSLSGCVKRIVGDIAAVADPDTGVQVYDSYGFADPHLIFGGTSVGAPIIAGVYGLAGHGASDASALYGAALNDVTGGSNGSCAGHGKHVNTDLLYLCTGISGYDGPTGNGTPNGTAGF